METSLGLGWVSQQIPFLSIGRPFLTYTWPAPRLSGISLPPLPPRAPLAGGEARQGVALPGWSSALPPAALLPSSGSGRAAPGNLWAPQPMRGRPPACSLFLGLQTPPRHCGRHLEPRWVLRTSNCGHAALTPVGRRRSVAAPGPVRRALLRVTATAALQHVTLTLTHARA